MAPFTFLNNIETEIPVAESGIRSRAVFSDDSVKVVAFGFAAGQELAAHTAPMAAILYFVRGEGELTVGGETMDVRGGAFVHMQAGVPHGILARTPMTLFLVMLKQVRGESA